ATGSRSSSRLSEGKAAFLIGPGELSRLLLSARREPGPTGEKNAALDHKSEPTLRVDDRPYSQDVMWRRVQALVRAAFLEDGGRGPHRTTKHSPQEFERAFGRDERGGPNIQGEITISGNGGSGDCAP